LDIDIPGLEVIKTETYDSKNDVYEIEKDIGFTPAYNFDAIQNDNSKPPF
jgi:hypothetical protein